MGVAQGKLGLPTIPADTSVEGQPHGSRLRRGRSRARRPGRLSDQSAHVTHARFFVLMRCAQLQPQASWTLASTTTAPSASARSCACTCPAGPRPTSRSSSRRSLSTERTARPRAHVGSARRSVDRRRPPALTLSVCCAPFRFACAARPPQAHQICPYSHATRNDICFRRP